MLLKKIKVIAVKKALKNALAEYGLNRSTSNGKVNSFACIINIDEFNHIEVFYELAKEMGLRQDQFKIIGFSVLESDNSHHTIPVFYSKDLGWGGKIENTDINELLNKEYDLLLNYFENTPLVLSLVSVYAKAAFKVGLTPKNQLYNNMVIDVKTNEFLKFKQEFLKYLSILNKI